MRADRFHKFIGQSVAFTGIQLLASQLIGCTGQLPGSFRWAQQNELMNVAQDINTKVDILWVVDNSASMDVSQNKLRNGFASFAATYLKPSWDIQLAVITTDTYLANPAFTTYWSTVMGGTTGYHSNYLNHTFAGGIRNNDQTPLINRDYAKLLSGVHDGPTTALCSEKHPYFFYGTTLCATRDQSANNTTAACLSPGVGESALTQCVNTTQNNTVRSGKPLISTVPPGGTAGDAAWVTELTNDFIVNVSVSTAGSGSERGLDSLSQFLDDNEATGSVTALFRENSIRLIIFVSDEDDQSMGFPTAPGAGYGPSTNYTSTCSAKTVDGHTYTVGVCPTSGSLAAVADYKTKLDTFFNNLDDSSTGSSTYFVASIVALSGQTISDFQADRDTIDNAIGLTPSNATDRGDRYLALGTLVGNGSLSLDMGDSDYSALLDSIGRAVALKRGTFTLKREPTGSEDMIVTIIHTNGSTDVISSSNYTVSGRTLTLTDVNYILSLVSTDQIAVNYQPRSVN